MGEQPVSTGRTECELASAEYDFLSDCESSGLKRPCRFRCLFISMQAHSAEIPPNRRSKNRRADSGKGWPPPCRDLIGEEIPGGTSDE